MGRFIGKYYYVYYSIHHVCVFMVADFVFCYQCKTNLMLIGIILYKIPSPYFQLCIHIASSCNSKTSIEVNPNYGHSHKGIQFAVSTIGFYYLVQK